MPKRPQTLQPADDRFARNQAAARLAMGWSVEELGKKIGVCGSSVWKTETAGRKVSIGEAVAISDAFGIDLQTMVLGDVEFVGEHRLVAVGPPPF